MENSRKVRFISRSLIGSAIAMAFLSAGQLSAVTLASGTVPTKISGYSGSAYSLVDTDKNRALYGIWSVERKDNPCYVATMTEDVNNAGNDSVVLKDLCGKDATSSQIKVQFSDSQFPAHTFVRSLRVCMNNKGTRVKGFQVRGRKIESNGTLTDLTENYPGGVVAGLTPLVDLNAPSDQRNNCNGNWKGWSECPSGTIATAVVAHFEAGSKPRSLTGLELKCRGVKP